MDELPPLQNLSAAEKDALLAELWAANQLLRQQLAILTERVQELEARSAKTSRNSSKPPSNVTTVASRSRS